MTQPVHWRPHDTARTDYSGVVLIVPRIPDPPGHVTVVRGDIDGDRGFDVVHLVPIELAFTLGPGRVVSRGFRG